MKCWQIATLLASLSAAMSAGTAHMVYPDLTFLPPLLGWIAGALWMFSKPRMLDALA